MFVVSIFTGIYYNMIVAWCFFYLFSSFAADVPWKGCDNPWNTPGKFVIFSLFLHQ
jgi:SNF family Na+-dependent transporter